MNVLWSNVADDPRGKKVRDSKCWIKDCVCHVTIPVEAGNVAVTVDICGAVEHGLHDGDANSEDSENFLKMYSLAQDRYQLTNIAAERDQGALFGGYSGSAGQWRWAAQKQLTIVQLLLTIIEAIVIIFATLFLLP